MHLSDYMAQRGLKDDDVATAIDRSRPTVSRIRRKRVRPDWKTIERLEEFSGGAVTASDFVDLGSAA